MISFVFCSRIINGFRSGLAVVYWGSMVGLEGCGIWPIVRSVNIQKYKLITEVGKLIISGALMA